MYSDSLVDRSLENVSATDALMSGRNHVSDIGGVLGARASRSMSISEHQHLGAPAPRRAVELSQR
jgi:hypothetical protein